MNYLEWNKKIWDYFFKDNLKNSGHKIVLAVNEAVIKEIGKDLSNPIEDFVNAINIGPKELSEGIEKFILPNTELDILSKAKFYIDNPNYTSRFGTKILRWSKEECLITAYLAYLVLMVTDENQYWSNVDSNLSIKTKTKSYSQNYTTELFEYLRKWAKKKGFNYFFKNLYTKKKNVGTIYSQLPLTNEEEKQVVASLYFAKKESQDDYAKLNDNPFYEDVVTFLDEQIIHLNDLTAKELNDYSSELREVIIDYTFQNISKYIDKCETANKEVMESILQTRKIKRIAIKPEYHLCIENRKITGVLIINNKLNEFNKPGEIRLKNKLHEYVKNTRNKRTVYDDKGEQYLAFYFDSPLIDGKYKIIIDNYDTGFQIDVRNVTDTTKPIWYRDFSKQNGNTLKIVDLSTHILFDINNPHKIITSNDFAFTTDDVVKYGIVSLGKNFQIQIGEDDSDKQIFGLMLSNIDKRFLLVEKSIEPINSQFEITLHGAPDGIQGKTSFLSNVPVTISLNHLLIKRVELVNEKGEIFNDISNFRTPTNDLDTIYSYSDNFDEGEYRIKVYDLKNINILTKEFCISKSIPSEQRVEKYIPYKICDFEKLKTLSTKSAEITECTFQIKKEIFENLIDILIKGKKITSIYDKDFKYILEALIIKYQPDILNDYHPDLTDLAKMIIYILDNLNIIEREVHYFKTIIKPYWIESSVDRRYDLIGALTIEERKEFKKITSIKAINQVVYRWNRNVQGKIGFELPSHYYVENCNEKDIPKIGRYELHKITDVFSFDIKESRKEIFDIETNILKVPTIDLHYFLTFNNIEVLNWFTLQYEAIKQERFKNLISYSGYKLFKFSEIKKHNNRIVEHFLLFEICKDGIYYSYFPYDQRQNALRLYLKKVEYFDFSNVYTLIKNDYLKDFQNKFLKGLSDNEIKSKLNFLDNFKLGTSPAKFNQIIKSQFIYDVKNFTFGINSAISIPKAIEKYLVSLSGFIPYNSKQRLMMPNKDISNIEIESMFIESDVNFTLFYNVPEAIAFKISNSLIRETVLKITGGTAKPYIVLNTK
jgi:hypothetical protein